MDYLTQLKTAFYAVLLAFFMIQCSGGPTHTEKEETSDNSSESIFEPIEEELPPGNQSPGFFLDSWQPKQTKAPPHQAKSKPSGKLDARIQVNNAKIITKVPAAIFGTNTNPYIGQMVDEPVLLDHLKNLRPHLIRAPGGNLSNLYFCNRSPEDPPGDVPPAEELLRADGTERVDEAYWYGNNNQDWTLSLDNYYQMLEETGTQGVIMVNYSYARYGTGTHPVEAAAGYAADWVRYDNGRTRYWEIGNENYGTWQAGFRIDAGRNKDGQPEIINGGLYGTHVKVFADSMRQAAREVGADIKIGAQLIERKVTEDWETDVVREWNSRYFEAAGDVADYYIVHNYYTPQQDSDPLTILNSAHDVTQEMMNWMNTTTSSNGAELKPIALTEWNIFSAGSQQMVSHISGVHASMVLGELIKHRYGMAARWNIANGWSNGDDHGMFNLGDAPGGVSKWSPRPAFYHMYYFQKVFGDRMIWSGTQGDPSLVSYASLFSSSHIGVVIVNTDTEAKLADVIFKEASVGRRYYWYTLSGGSGSGEFSRKVFVNREGPEQSAGGPENYKNIKAYSALVDDEEGVKVEVPAQAVVYLLIEVE